MAKIKYGLEWDDSYEDWLIELKCYQFPHWVPKKHRQPKHVHFIRACQMLWGPNNPKAQFTWHPWAVDMCIQACANKELGLCGPSSCGKSEFSAVWILGNVLADPAHTLSYVTSTTIPVAKQKIWGAVTKYFNAIPPHCRAMLSLVENPTPAIWVDWGGKRILNAGVHLVACASSQGREAVNKLQGAKANEAPGALSTDMQGHSRLVFMADELSDLTHAILSAMDNLKSNAWTSFVAAANPRNKLDPFSRFVEPEDGWDSISVDTSIWKTKRGGVCLHFDDVKSPNLDGYLKYLEEVAEGKHRDEDNNIVVYRKQWPIKGGDKIHEEMNTADVLSPLYWRNCRGFWSPVADELTIYTDEDIKAAGADRHFHDWYLTKPKVRAMGVDSAFSSGGDETIAVIADMGYCAKRRCHVVDIIAVEEIHTNAADKTRTHTRQVGDKVKELAQKYQVPIPDIGFDSTNHTAADALAEALGSNDFFRVGFAGAATSTPVSDLDMTPANEKYGNRVTELWFFGKELLRHRQLHGISDDIALQLIVRRYDTTKASGVTRLTAESKKDMRKRTGGSSPDRADAMAIVLDVFRQRHGLRTTETKLADSANGTQAKWLEFCKTQSSARKGRRISLRAR